MVNPRLIQRWNDRLRDKVLDGSFRTTEARTNKILVANEMAILTLYGAKEPSNGFNMGLLQRRRHVA